MTHILPGKEMVKEMLITQVQEKNNSDRRGPGGMAYDSRGRECVSPWW